MDPRGNIVELTEEQKKTAEKLEGIVGDLVQIPHDELVEVEAMNRQERRAWYAKKRRELRAAKRRRDGCPSDDEHDHKGRAL